MHAGLDRDPSPCGKRVIRYYAVSTADQHRSLSILPASMRGNKRPKTIHHLMCAVFTYEFYLWEHFSTHRYYSHPMLYSRLGRSARRISYIFCSIFSVPAFFCLRFLIEGSDFIWSFRSLMLRWYTTSIYFTPAGRYNARWASGRGRRAHGRSPRAVRGNDYCH